MRQPWISMMTRLAECAFLEHEKKCELLGCEGPEEGDHQRDKCRICKLIYDAQILAEKETRK